MNKLTTIISLFLTASPGLILSHNQKCMVRRLLSSRNSRSREVVCKIVAGLLVEQTPGPFNLCSWGRRSSQVRTLLTFWIRYLSSEASPGGNSDWRDRYAGDFGACPGCQVTRQGYFDTLKPST